MPLITQRSIDEILDRADIVDVISSFIELKKAGSTFKGLSPWTDEKSPSFFVVPSKQIFKCFSSGKGGSAVTFLMEAQHMSYPEAITFLADKYGMEIEYDEPDEKAQEKYDKLDRQRKLLSSTNNQYRKILHSEPGKAAFEYLTGRGFTKEEIIEWQIGYAGDEWTTIADLARESGFLNDAIELGICSSKNNRTFDFFRSRLTIPIFDRHGQVIGFGGRTIDPENKTKYINSRESLTYDKSRVLFGIDRARTSIAKSGMAFLSEGYLDVIAMHRIGVENIVATCGTALTPEQCKVIKKMANTIVLLRDGDPAGQKAAARDIDIAIAVGLSVKIVELPAGDPDDFVQSGGTMQQLIDRIEDALIWRLIRDAGDREDPKVVGTAIEKMCDTLALISNGVVQDAYVKMAAKALKVGVKDIKPLLKAKTDKKEREVKYQTTSSESDIGEARIQLPPGSDRDFFDKYGYVEAKGEMWCRHRSHEGVFRASNFILRPMFHIHRRGDDRRLFQLIKGGTMVQMEIPSAHINQKTAFENALAEQPGNYYFTADFTQYHFKSLMNSLCDQMKLAYPIITLGRQSEGFFSFADGIATGDGFKQVNEFGMVSHVQKKQDVEKETHFYLPAFAESNKYSRADSDEYENERKLQFKESPVSLGEYFQLFYDAFGPEKAMLGIAFLVASCYRDSFVRKFNFFPLMFCWGEKSSGKSAFALALQNFFFYREKPFMLNAGTDVGFFRRLARVANVINFMDEYQENITEDRFQALKSAWNAVGREKGMMSKDNRTETSKCLSSLVICGQYMAARDDHSLTSRSILLEFQVGQFTDKQVAAYKRIEQLLEEGMSSLVCELIKHDEMVSKNIAAEYNRFQGLFNDRLKGKRIMSRIISNYACLCAHVSLLKKSIDLPFDMNELFERSLIGIKYTDSQIADTEALGEFWSTFAALIEENAISEGPHYSLNRDHGHSVIIDGENVNWSNRKNDEVLLINASAVYMAYKVHCTTKQRSTPLGRTVLVSYLQARKEYWIGEKASWRFSDRQSRAWVVNYTEMKRHGMTLPFRDGSADSNRDQLQMATSIPTSHQDPGDLPF